jgi:hypothetical protein
MKYFIQSIIVVVCLFVASTFCYSQSPEVTDHDLVHVAVEDYVLGLYEVSPERIARSVDTSLTKVGYYDHNGKAHNHAPMTYQQLYNLSSSWNKKGDKINEDSPKRIEIYEVNDKTAAAKLTAEWGIDFMHLCKVDGKWKIRHIMWQSDPK